ncbi:MAG: hypothetical protein IH968_18735 [Gemmatimonadetes bacterium]|nr:hypothetical protein [Gemmatimonadota bacterium]
MIQRHMIFADDEGRPLDVLPDSLPTTDWGGLRPGALGVYLGRVMDSISVARDSSITIFIHGGLVPTDEALHRGRVMLERVIAFNYRVPELRTYPLWFNWAGGAVQSLGERAIHRHGDSSGSTLLSVATLLPRLGLGLGRAVLEAPRTTLDQLSNWTRRDGNVEANQQRIAELQTLKPELSISALGDQVPPGFWNGALTVATAATGLVLGPILADGAATPVWKELVERTRWSMWSADDTGTESLPQRGALRNLLDSLQARYDSGDAGGAPLPRRIVLVGHSMGAIIANQVLTEFPDLPVSDIVYLAGAASIRETALAVVPVLRRNSAVQFWNVTLHPGNEAKDVAIPFLASGSFLEWIDRYHEPRGTSFDAMVGRFENFLRGVDAFPDSVLGQIHLKAIGEDDPGYRPFRHGQFGYGEFPYWDPARWRQPD